MAGIEPRRCDFCGWKFGSASEKKSHTELAHREELQKMNPEHVCRICGKDCTNPAGLGAHRLRAHGLHKGEDMPREGVGVVPPQEDIATPEEMAAEEQAQEHCVHVVQCGVTGVTECGDDPCNLVAKWRETRCEVRTAPNCQKDPCHDCELYPAEESDERHVTLRDLVADGIEVRIVPDLRMELIETYARLARAQVADVSRNNHCDALPTLERIIELVKGGAR